MQVGERILAILASILTIITFFYSLPAFLGGAIPAPLVDVQGLGVPYRVVISILLVCSLGYCFGLLFGVVTKLKNEPLTMLLYAIGATLAAGVSIATLEVILVGRTLIATNDMLLFGLLVAAACGILCVFVFMQVNRRDTSFSGMMAVKAIGIQILLFALLYVSLFFREL